MTEDALWVMTATEWVHINYRIVFTLCFVSQINFKWWPQMVHINYEVVFVLCFVSQMNFTGRPQWVHINYEIGFILCFVSQMNFKWHSQWVHINHKVVFILIHKKRILHANICVFSKYIKTQIDKYENTSLDTFSLFERQGPNANYWLIFW